MLRVMELRDGRIKVMSAVFLPLSFVVGFFGQNFELPFAPNWVQSDRLMSGMVFVCIALPLVMLGWFRHKRWL